MKTKPIISSALVAVSLSVGVNSVAFAQGGKLGTTADRRLPPKAQDMLKEFHRIYVLDDGEVVKHFAPPFHPGRYFYYSLHEQALIHRDAQGPDNYFFRWRNDRLVSNNGASFGVGPLRELISLQLDFHLYEMEGDEEILDTRIQGDWIIRDAVPDEKILVGMEKILRSQLRIPAKLSVQELDRKVFVAEGDLDLKPVGKFDRIEVYGKVLVPKGGGGGSGDIDAFLRGVSRFIGKRVVSGVTPPPDSRLKWHYNSRSPYHKYGQEDRDVEGVLNHVTEQTGLTFTQAVRRVRVLKIERAE